MCVCVCDDVCVCACVLYTSNAIIAAELFSWRPGIPLERAQTQTLVKCIQIDGGKVSY